MYSGICLAYRTDLEDKGMAFTDFVFSSVCCANFLFGSEVSGLLFQFNELTFVDCALILVK